MQIDCEMLVKSIGYRSNALPGVPFDPKTNTVPNRNGCVIDDKGNVIPGLYVAGWAKRGPIGIIDSTLRDTMETVRHISHHLNEDLLPEKKTSIDEIMKLVDRG